MINTQNQPAFPCQDIIERNEKGQLIGHEISGAGLTMRDYFAAKAMNGLLAGILSDGSQFSKGDPGKYSITAYLIADAMLQVREQ